MAVAGLDSQALRTALSKPVLKRSLAVMLVVGTVLNAINQGDAFLNEGPINWIKVVLTFCVPFLVSTYGAFSAAQLSSQRTQR